MQFGMHSELLSFRSQFCLRGICFSLAEQQIPRAIPQRFGMTIFDKYSYCTTTEIRGCLENKGRLIPSNRRLRRHLRLRPRPRSHHHPLPRLRRLPRRVPAGGRHRLLPANQKHLGRDILDVFCSCLMVRLVALRNRKLRGRRISRGRRARARGTIHSETSKENRKWHKKLLR
jgi:hypothetical protein